MNPNSTDITEGSPVEGRVPLPDADVWIEKLVRNINTLNEQLGLPLVEVPTKWPDVIQ